MNKKLKIKSWMLFVKYHPVKVFLYYYALLLTGKTFGYIVGDLIIGGIVKLDKTQM